MPPPPPHNHDPAKTRLDPRLGYRESAARSHVDCRASWARTATAERSLAGLKFFLPGGSAGVATPRGQKTHRAGPDPLPFPLPLGGAIRGDSSAFSPNACDEQSSENAENSRDVNVVAPRGFVAWWACTSTSSCRVLPSGRSKPSWRTSRARPVPALPWGLFRLRVLQAG